MQMGSKQGFSFVCTPVGSFDFSPPILFLWYLQRLRTPDWNLECLHANAVPEKKNVVEETRVERCHWFTKKRKSLLRAYLHGGILNSYLECVKHFKYHKTISAMKVKLSKLSLPELKYMKFGEVFFLV